MMPFSTFHSTRLKCMLLTGLHIVREFVSLLSPILPDLGLDIEIVFVDSKNSQWTVTPSDTDP